MNQINDSHTINIPAFISELNEIDENGAIFGAAPNFRG